MSASKVFDWLANPALNNLAVPDGAPEGWNPDEANNVLREVMASIRVVMTDFPWLELTRKDVAGAAVTVAKLTDTVFEVQGADYRTIYAVGRQVRMTGATTEYGRITGSSFTAGDTEVTVTVDASGVVPASLTAVDVSCMTPESGVVLSSTLSQAALSPFILGGNVVRDPSFEAGDLLSWKIENGGGTGWDINGTAFAGAWAARYQVGAQSAAAYLLANSTDDTDSDGHVAAHGGDQFAFRCHVLRSGTIPGVSLVSLGCRFFDEAGVQLGDSFGTPFEPSGAWARQTFVTAAAAVGTVYVVPALKIMNGSPAGTIYHFDDLDFRHKLGVEETPQYAEAALPSVASAASITLADRPDVINITGTTQIDTINGFYNGRRVTLLFAGILKVGDATGNVLLVGDFTTAAGDTLTLVYNGANWEEVSRKAHGAVPTVASAATVTLADDTDVVKISGAVAITSVAASRPGRRVTLIFLAALTFTAGSNLKIAGNFVTTADDTITLVSDGVDWHEVGRSVNA